MGRITRAKAAEVAEQIHIDEDAFQTITDLTFTKPDTEERPALGEISGNVVNLEDTETSSKGSGKKGGSSKKNQKKKSNGGALGESTYQQTLEVIPDEVESLPSPASRAASDDLLKNEPELEMAHLAGEDMRQSSAVRLTRSQLKKAEAEPKSLVDLKDPSNTEGFELEVEGGVDVPVSVSDDVFGQSETVTECKKEAPILEENEEMPNFLQSSRDEVPMTPTKQKRVSMVPTDANADEDQERSYDELEAAAVEAQTPPRSSTKDSSNDSITALDNLDDEVERVKSQVPEVQTSPEKPKAKKAAPVVRTTKASQARISLAHGPKDAPKAPSWGRPSMAGARESTAGRRIASTSSDKLNGAEKRESIIPHSKPRPISMSFPTPPPPPKSTKAPTKSTFQLPGEAISAKLKAAKEARLAKEAEDAKKKTFKARPAPTSTKTPAVRQTSTSKARESLMTGKPLAASTSGAHKRANSVATTRPASGPRPTSVKPAPATKPPPAAAKKSTTPNSSSLTVTKRPATAMASLTKPQSRPATASKPTTTTATTAKPPSKTISKGKEVFSRAAQAKSAAEKEKREKEAAAKKARAEAAERGRQLSREWAEKQRLKKLGGLKKDGEVKTKENVEPVEVEGGEV